MRNRLLTRLFGATMAEERKIGGIATLVLLAVSLLSFAALFGVFKIHVDEEFKEGLVSAANDRAKLFQAEIERASEVAANIGTYRLRLHQLMFKVASGTAVKADLQEVGEILDRIVESGKITAIALYDARGTAIQMRGKFVAKPEVAADLAARYRTTLMWQKGYVLNVAVPFADKGVKFGEALVELPLASVTEMLGNYASLGKTGEIVLCSAAEKNRMKCFPSRHSPGGFEVARSLNGRPLPMSYALDGESGVIATVDYRDQAAFAAVRPVGSLGLGMVVKKDASESSQSFVEHFLLVLPLLVLLLVLGAGLLRWGLVPQVRAIVGSRTRAFAILDNLAEGVVAFDGKGTIELFNPAAAKIFGYAPGEALGQNVQMLVPEPFHGSLDQYLGKRLQLEAPATMGLGRKAIMGRRRNGESFPMDFSVRETALGEHLLFIAVARDISARVWTEQALRESERGQRRLAEQQTSILEALPASIALLDQEGNIITANSAWWNQVNENDGQENKLHVGSNYLEQRGEAGASPASDLAQATEGIRAVLKGEKPFFTMEYPCPDESDVPCWLRMIVNPLQAEKKEGVVVMYLDITERKLAEEARSRFVAILEATTDFVCMADASGRMFYLNRAGRKARGIGKGEDISRLHISDFFPYWASQIISNTALPAAAADGAWAGETAFVCGDGREVPVLQVVLAHKTADGTVDYYSTIMHDISQRKQGEEELRASHAELQQAYRRLEEAQGHLLQSEKMASIGQLAAGVAHEINNPIGYVHSNLGTLEKYLAEMLAVLDAYEKAERELAQSPTALPAIKAAKEGIDLAFLKEDVPALMSESKEGISRVKQIVQNLKDFSHGGAEDEWQWADLRKGLDSTLNIVWNELKYKAEVVKEYGELPEVECLPSQLNQVFMNLLVNAGHAIEDRGVITIRTGTEGEQVWVEIADTGKGIAPEHLNKIFDPFFTTKPVGKGTGLGLSLSYSIVQKHKGRIEVQSEVGKGTAFRVWLPQRRAAIDKVDLGIPSLDKEL